MAQAKTLFEYYQQKGQALPGIKERAKTFENLGLGSAENYAGTTDQNVSLLSRLQSMPVTPSPALNPSVAPNLPVSAPSSTQNLYGQDLPTRTALLDEYRKKLGLDTLEQSMNSDLANTPKKYDIYTQETSALEPERQQLKSLDDRLAEMKNSIDTSEQDIRKRITDSGGVVTESQVERLVASEKQPLIDEYNSLLDQRNRLAGNLTTEESQAEQRASLKYEDASAALTADQTKYKVLSDLFSQLYGAGEKDLETQIDAAKSAAEKRKADVITTQTDQSGNVSVVTREADGTFKVNSIGNIGKPVTSKTTTGQISAAEQAQLDEINTTKQNLDKIENVVSKPGFLPSGPFDYLKILNPIEATLQTDSEKAAFSSWRTAAIQSLRALAGSKGLRINQAEINAAMQNDMPKITDTLPVAQQKLTNLRAQIASWETTILGTPASGGQTDQTDINSLRTKYGY